MKIASKGINVKLRKPETGLIEFDTKPGQRYELISSDK
jgi:hypothetical protein